MAFVPVLIICILFTINFLDNASATIPSVEQYFTDLEGESARLQWFHAVNNKSLLAEALSIKSVHMLEADVVYGTLLDGSGPKPIMGHPPANTSDLSLEEFITAVIDVQGTEKKGIKLDIKSDEAYKASWEIINKKKNSFSFPVWLNADVLVGPGNPQTKPLDPRKFVSSARDNLPDATLSLGWTTSYADELGYTDEMLKEMLTLVKDQNIKQPITLAVRAAFTSHSTNAVQNLVEEIDKFQDSNQTSLTIWMSSNGDVVDTKKLHQLLVKLGKHKVFLDAPITIKNRILKGNASTSIIVAQGALAAVLSAVSVAATKILLNNFLDYYRAKKNKTGDKARYSISSQ